MDQVIEAIRTAVADGATDEQKAHGAAACRAILGRLALRPALNPVIALLALVFAYSLANTFLVEAIFNWPGLGSYAATSIGAVDTPAILGVTLLVAVAYVLLNLVVDVVQTIVDPRLRSRT